VIYTGLLSIPLESEKKFSTRKNNFFLKNYLQIFSFHTPLNRPPFIKTYWHKFYYFQQDGAKHHTSNRVQKWLGEKFGNKFIQIQV
jgi:hypothetical protein